MLNVVFELFRLILLVLLLLFKFIWLLLLNWYCCCCCWIWSCNELAFWKLCKFNCCCDVKIGALNGALIVKFRLFWLLLLLLLLLFELWKLFNNVDLFCENGDWLRFNTGKSDGSNGENRDESAVSENYILIYIWCNSDY